MDIITTFGELQWLITMADGDPVDSDVLTIEEDAQTLKVNTTEHVKAEYTLKVTASYLQSDIL